MKVNKFITALLLNGAIACVVPASLYAQEVTDGQTDTGVDYTFTSEEAKDLLGFDRIPDNDVAFAQIAFLRSNEPNDQENAALKFFRAAYPSGQVLTVEDFMSKTDLQLRSISLLWIHADRPGMEKGWSNLAQYYTSGDDATGELFADRLAFFVGKTDGVVETYDPYAAGNLYLSGQAVQILYAIGRLPEDLPYIYDEDLNTELRETWSINSNFNSGEEHEYHAIYGSPNPATGWVLKHGYLAKMEDLGGRYNTMAPDEGVDFLNLYNHNTMWDYNKVPDGVGHSYEDFRKTYHCVGLGAWGHTHDVTELGIVEFLPGHATAYGNSPAVSADTYRNFNGNIIANGMACCQFLPYPEYGNRYQHNIYRLTFNTINYLTGEFQENPDLTMLTAYQLVSMVHPDEEGYNYVTYYGPENNWASGAYKLKVEVDEGEDSNPRLLAYQALDDVPDYKDGTEYQFSSKVLLVSNSLSEARRDKVIGYQLQGLDASSKGFKDGKIYGESTYCQFSNEADAFDKTYMHTGDDADKGRYFRIVEPRITRMEDGPDKDYPGISEGFKYTYSVRMLYTADNGETKISEPGTVTHYLVIPSPRLIDARMEMFYGEDKRLITNNATKKFVYDGLELQDARYQNLHKVFEIENPNISDRFRAKALGYIRKTIDDDVFVNNNEYAPISTGLFAIQTTDSTGVIESMLYDLGYLEPDDDDNIIRYEGPTHVFGHLTADTDRWITLSVAPEFVEEIPILYRWEDTPIRPLVLTDEPPVLQSLNGESKLDRILNIDVKDLSFDENNNLIETTDIILQLRSSKIDLTTDEGKNELIGEQISGVAHEEIVDDNTKEGINYAKRFQRIDDEDVFVLARPLKFGTCDDEGYKDYYLMRLEDENGIEIEKRLVTALEFAEGVTVQIVKNHGPINEDELEDHQKHPYYTSLKMSISYLYPFDHSCDDPTHGHQQMPMRRVASAEEGIDMEDAGTDVMESQPSVIELSKYMDIITSLDSMTADRGLVRTGKGFIEVAQADVNIFTPTGLKVASGAGCHYLPAGIYVVRINNSSKKVMVR